VFLAEAALTVLDQKPKFFQEEEDGLSAALSGIGGLCGICMEISMSRAKVTLFLSL